MGNPDGAMSFPENWPMESFYYSAGSIKDMPGSGSAGLVGAAEATDFRYVEDLTPAPGNFALALKSRINPFLVREERVDHRTRRRQVHR